MQTHFSQHCTCEKLQRSISMTPTIMFFKIVKGWSLAVGEIVYHGLNCRCVRNGARWGRTDSSSVQTLQADFEEASARHRQTTRYFSHHMPIEDFDTLFQDFEMEALPESREEKEHGTKAKALPLQPAEDLSIMNGSRLQ